MAISVDEPEDSKALVDKLKLPFPILSDADLATIRAYSTEHEGFDIAVPATFVISQDGKVSWSYRGSKKDRPDTADVIAAAKAAAGG